ncbi:Protein RTF1-like protein [Zea mays]|uniref:Protein RTF1-like protein n=1 Tax=Zea mays TaxID=4577 RepID=A0A1D6IWM8_MAIZE|nr:Protein RTF1-like protein [Zea mays]
MMAPSRPSSSSST